MKACAALVGLALLQAALRRSQNYNRGQKLKMMILRDLTENVEIAGYSRVEGQAFVLCSVQGPPRRTR